MKKVLILASGLSAREVDNYDYKANDWTIVAVNNGWLATPLWDHWVRANNYKGKKPDKIEPPKVEINKYGKYVTPYGGQKQCGFSITLTAGYYVLQQFDPDVIGFLGADMNYTPQADGSTHIYGIGYDVKTNNIPDPDKMVKEHGKDDPNYLENIYLRFSKIAKEQHNTQVYNFSSIQDTRLPYPKNNPRNFE